MILSSCETVEQPTNDSSIGIIIIGQLVSEFEIDLDSIGVKAGFSRSNDCDNHIIIGYGAHTNSAGIFTIRMTDFGYPIYACVEIIVSPDLDSLFYPDTLLYPNTYLNRTNNMDTLTTTIELNRR
jgi:hypothetical protein